MELTALFMISCILTARKLEKMKMRSASILYSVAFIVIVFVLLFVADIEIVRRALINFIGKPNYLEIHNALLDAMEQVYYGVSVFGAIAITFAIQFIAVIFSAASAVVRYCFTKKALVRKFKKAYFRFARPVRTLCLPKRINLLYCRMLN